MKSRLWLTLLVAGLLALVIGMFVPPQHRFGGAISRSRHKPPLVNEKRTIAPASPQRRRAGTQIAIIIDDCGQAIDIERAMIALPIPLTLAVLPSAPYTKTIEREAAAAHKGIMLHLPMESLAHLNPGPGKITTEMPDDQIASQVRDDLRDVPLASGINNHEGSEATADLRVMRAVMGVAATEHRFFIDSRTTLKTTVVRAAREAGVQNASRNVFLDNEADPAYVDGMLRRTAAIGKRDGTAIAIGHPRPATLSALRSMIAPLRAAGVEFTLAANLLHR